MKKLALTIAIVLGLSMTTFADGGGLFQRGISDEQLYGEGGNRDLVLPSLPNHNETENQDGNSPLGTGIAVMLGLGAAYLVGKKRSED